MAGNVLLVKHSSGVPQCALAFQQLFTDCRSAFRRLYESFCFKRSATSWFISEPAQADGLIRDGKVDVVMLGRPLLANPHWPYRAARELSVDRAAWVLPAPYAHWLDRYHTA